MIAEMAEASPLKRSISPATLALGGAAILALAAIGYKLAGPGEASPPAAAKAAAQPQAASLDETVATLEEAVRREPDDHGKWFLLGLAYRDLERFGDAAGAFRRAMQLDPDDPKYYTYLGEALLLQGGPTPPQEAEQLFRRALQMQPGNPASRFYLATLRDSRGEHQAAIDELIALLGDAPADAPWEPQVRQAVTAIAQQRRIDISGRLPPPRQPDAATATAAIPGPTSEQMEAARAIPPSQQDAMVQGMVEGLANRLRRNPRDADGWIRLMRSRMVLEDPDAARTALRSGLAAFDGDAATQQRLRAAATELGVPAG